MISTNSNSHGVACCGPRLASASGLDGGCVLVVSGCSLLLTNDLKEVGALWCVCVCVCLRVCFCLGL
jgi:hypothetical protein